MPEGIEVVGDALGIPAALADHPAVVWSLRTAGTPQAVELVLAAIASLDDDAIWNALRPDLGMADDGTVTVGPDALVRQLVAAPHRVPVALHVLTKGRPDSVTRLRVALGFLRRQSMGHSSLAPSTLSLASLEWLKSFPNLESLVVAGVSSDTDVSPLRSLSRLRSLRFTECESLPDLDTLTKLPALESLDLSGNGWLEESALAKLAVLGNLRRIDLSGCRNIRDTSALESLEGVEIVVEGGGSQEAADDEPPPAAAGPFADPPGTVTNSIGMKLVPIPAGEFLMGSPEDCPLGDTAEEFQHPVRITRPFLLGMHQVTQAHYEQVTGGNPSHFKGPDLPVEHLFWKDARRFCELLSELPAERAAGRRYRLPTEAEWEYACRAGTTTPYNTGDSLEPHQARFAQGIRTESKQTAPVGTYPPNAWGLFDMHGNVWEWTGDWFSAEYFQESPVEDPQGPPTGTHHALRGGSASVLDHECRTAIRGESPTDDPDDEGGAMRSVATSASASCAKPRTASGRRRKPPAANQRP